MVRFGVRLTFRGGREAITRLAVIAIAVALGVGMLLITLAGISAVNSQNARFAWLESGTGGPVKSGQQPVPGSATAQAGSEPDWLLLNADVYHGKIIGRVDIAATGPSSPVPPGMSRVPAAGEYFASPAMQRLLRATPAAELADRYPGHLVGTIDNAALPAPNTLLIVVGHSPSQLSSVDGAEQVAAFNTTPPNQCNGACADIGIDSNGIDLVLSVASAALLFPILIFIGTASRLSTARREQRFAAMRLVGATPAQITMISTVESSIAAVIGVALGFVVFFGLRGPLASIPFTGAPFFTHDLSLSLPDIAIVVIGVPIAAAVAARIALRRVQVSPLGVTRRATPRRPNPIRLVPVFLGIGELVFFVHHGRPPTTGGQIAAYLPAILVTMVGLVLAGPWLTMAGSRLMVWSTRRPSVLIAGRRLGDDPRAGFRAVSGLVLAMFVTSTAIGMLATINYYNGHPNRSRAAETTIANQFSDFNAAPHGGLRAVPATALSRIETTPGVTAVASIYHPPHANRYGPEFGVMSCRDVAKFGSLFAHCARGAAVTSVNTDFSGNISPMNGLGRLILPAPTVSTVAALDRSRVEWLLIATTGSPAVIEHVRTVVENLFPDESQPLTVTEIGALDGQNQKVSEYRQLIEVVLLTSLPIAGCGLAVSVAAGLADRKRAFSLLRLAGSPLRMLRRVVLLETAMPLVVIAALSSGVGFLVAYLFLRSQLGERLQAPGASYFLLSGGGLVASLAIIASTFPLLARITGPETARND